jgi:hypothetical protein
MVVANRAAVELVVDSDRVRVVGLARITVCEQIVEVLARRQLRLVELRPVIHPVVGVDALTEEVRELVGGEFRGEVFELIRPARFEVFDEGSETRAEKLQRVFEDDVTTPAEGQVLLKPLRHDCDIALVVAERANDQVRVVSPEVVKEDRDIERLLQAQVALDMRRTSKRASNVAMITSLESELKK